MGRRRVRRRGRRAALLPQARQPAERVRGRAARGDAAATQALREDAGLALSRRPHVDHRRPHERGGSALMRILGIDPGLQTTGFGVVDADGYTLQYVASGTISTMHLERGDLPARLKVLYDGIGELHARYQP